MTRSTALVVAVLLLGNAAPSFAAPPAPALAKQKTLGETLTGQAKADYEAGRTLVADGDFAGAAIKFKSAYDVSKDPRLLWNLAACEKSLRHYARAIELVKQYIADAPLSDKDLKEANELVKTFEPFTVALSIEVNEPDADIEVDDKLVGKTPLKAPLVVDIGQRKILVRKPGFRAQTTTVSVGGSAAQSVSLKLEKELHEGKVGVVAPTHATIAIDGQLLGPGKGVTPVEVTLPSGGHTLSVKAAGMRPYEREVVVTDNEARTIEVVLEREVEALQPSVRVAVGCSDARPRTPNEGLQVSFDNTGSLAVSTGVKRVWDKSKNDYVIDHVEYRLAPGPHTISVRIDGCKPLDTQFVVDQQEGATIRGSLPSNAGIGARGPAGVPNWARIALSLWLPQSFIEYDNVRPTNNGAAAFTGLEYKFSGAGLSVQPGVSIRFWTMSLDLAHAAGTAEIDKPPAATDQGIRDRINNPNMKFWRAGIRSGFRFPFDIFAFQIGLGTGYDNIYLEMPAGLENKHPHMAYGMAWTALDIYAFCDWALFGGWSAEFHNEEAGGTMGFQFGGVFQPNRRCSAERTEHSLKTGKGQPVRGLL